MLNFLRWQMEIKVITMSSKEDKLQQFLLDNNMSDNVSSIEYFSTEDLSKDSVHKIFEMTHPIFSGNIDRISVRSMTYAEKLILSKHKLTEPIFQICQLSNLYSSDHEFGQKDVDPPYANYEAANLAWDNLDEVRAKDTDSLSFEELHAILLSDCFNLKSFNLYTEALYTFNQKYKSILDTSVVYCKTEYKKRLKLSMYIYELQAFNQLGVDSVAVRIKYENDDGLIAKINNGIINVYRSRQEEDRDSYSELESELNKAIGKAELEVDKYGSTKKLGSKGFDELKSIYDKQKDSDLIRTIKGATLLEKVRVK